MSNSAKVSLAPKLRFPEFRDAGGWEVKALSSFSKVGDIDHKMPSSVIDGIPYIMTGNFFGINGIDFDNAKKVSVEDYEQLVKKIKPEFGDIVIARYASVGAVRYIETKSKFLVSYSCAVVKCNKSEASKYLYYILQSDVIQSKIGLVINASSQKNIGIDSIKKLNIFIPTLREQQKIADCLSSLDELIAAQARKVDALKTHKKGLMQQLFPRDGETQPRLRFTEFQNAGAWEETRLGKMGVLVSGLTYSPDDVRESGLLVLRSSNVQQGKIALDDCVYVDPSIKGANLSQPNDILICVRNGSKALIGKCALIPEGMPLCTHGAFMTVFRAKLPDFIFQLFQSDRYQKQVAGDLGATINSINGSQLLKYEFSIPKPAEQQRIADCLTSLDTLITAATQELETRKTHKKGLMQQLFPSAEAVEA